MEFKSVRVRTAFRTEEDTFFNKQSYFGGGVLVLYQGRDFSRAIRNRKRLGLLAPAGAYPARNTLIGANSGPKKPRGFRVCVRTQTLKPSLVQANAARLKSCPDTKHKSRESGKTRAFRRFESIANPALTSLEMRFSDFKDWAVML